MKTHWHFYKCSPLFKKREKSAIQIKLLHLWEEKVGISSQNTPEFTPGKRCLMVSALHRWVGSYVQDRATDLLFIPAACRTHSQLSFCFFPVCWACGVPMSACLKISLSSIDVCSKYRLTAPPRTVQVFVLSYWTSAVSCLPLQRLFNRRAQGNGTWFEEFNEI